MEGREIVAVFGGSGRDYEHGVRVDNRGFVMRARMKHSAWEIYVNVFFTVSMGVEGFMRVKEDRNLRSSDIHR